MDAGGGGGGLEEEMDRWMTAIRHLPQRTSDLELTGVAQPRPPPQVTVSGEQAEAVGLALSSQI